MPRQQISFSASQRSIRFNNGTVLEVSPFIGTATQYVNEGTSLRSARLPAETDTSPAFERAMQELGIYEQETIHLDVAASAGLRGYGVPANDRVILHPGPGNPHEPSVRVVLYQDESGGISWHFAEGALLTPAQREVMQKRGLRMSLTTEPVFIIPTRTGEAQTALRGSQAPSALRGPITKWGRKIFKILVMPVAAALLEKPVQMIVGSIEKKHRQNLIWGLRPDTYTASPSAEYQEWVNLDTKPSLLVVHGIFSTVEGMLSGLPRQAMEELFKAYEGRVIGFNHLSVTESPEENARFFLEQLKRASPEGKFVFDVLCHSRGGIVARALAETGKVIFPDGNSEFRKIFFVATPNHGSVLANPERITDMIDVFTNLLTNFPDGTVMYSIEIFLAIIKLVAFTAERSLPGLASMGTDGYIKQVLNAASEQSPAAYACAAANYQPDPNVDNAFFTGPFVNTIIDRVFKTGAQDVANDLVVPREGVYAPNGHPSFPIPKPLIFQDAAHVWHSGFFQRAETFERIKQHLEIDGVASSASGNISQSPSPPARRGSLRGARSGQGASQKAAWGSSSEREAPQKVAWGSPSERGRPQKTAWGSSSERGKPQKTAWGSSSDRGGRTMSVDQEPSGTLANEAETETTRTESFSGADYFNKDSAISATPPPPTQLQREPHIRYHEAIREGDTEPLTVFLSCIEEAGEVEKVISLVFGQSETEVDLSVTLDAPGFDVIGPNAQKMKVKRERDPNTEQVEFQVTPRNPGSEPTTKELRAVFWLRNSCVGSVSHFTVVIPKSYTGSVKPDGRSKIEKVAIPRIPRMDCDLIIQVQRDRQNGKDIYEISLRCRVPGEEYEGKDGGQFDLDGKDLATYLSEKIDPAFTNYPDDPNFTDEQYKERFEKWAREFMEKLKVLGKELWKRLPEKFRNEYFRLQETEYPPRSIFVHSDEMIFPWELVIPWSQSDKKYVELPPLGLAHVLGRWKPGLGLRPNPQKMLVKKLFVLSPKYPSGELAWTIEETRELKQIVPSLEVITPADLPSARKVLSRSDVQVLHFSGHGRYDPSVNADLVALKLEAGDELTADEFGACKLGVEAQPILYLNACTVGRVAKVAGRMGGFAGNCLDGGWSGVIAPYWPINDLSAMEFSRGLYGKLLSGRSIGEALQELREEKPEEPTYWSYSFFGDPWARAVLA